MRCLAARTAGAGIPFRMRIERRLHEPAPDDRYDAVRGHHEHFARAELARLRGAQSHLSAVFVIMRQRTRRGTDSHVSGAWLTLQTICRREPDFGRTCGAFATNSGELGDNSLSKRGVDILSSRRAAARAR